MPTTLNQIYLRTLQQFRSDVGILIFCVVVPLAYPLLYAFLYNGETVHEVPAVVVDQCQSALSREFVRKVDATADVRIISHAQDLNDAQQFIRHREAYGIIFIPRDFERQIVRGAQAHVQIYSDMSGLLYYKALLSSTTNVSLDMNAQIKSSRKAIVYDDVAIYNTQTGFAGFLIPAVLMLILQQTLILGIGMARGTETELRRFEGVESIFRMSRSQTVTLGISAAFLTVYIPVSIWCLGVVPRIFSLNSIGNFWEVLIFTLPYLLACIFFAISIGSICRQRESIVLLGVFTSIPFLFLTGVSWPGSNIPNFWREIASFIPSTYGVTGYIKLNSMGAHLPEVMNEWIHLWFLTIGWFLIAWFSVIRQIWPESFHRKLPIRRKRRKKQNSKELN